MDQLNVSLLESIDYISESVNESEIDVINSMINAYEKQTQIVEYCEDINSLNEIMVFQESSSDNILKKIWNAIKKFFGMIVTKVKKIIHDLTNKSTTNSAGNVPVESVSALAEEVLSKGASKNKPDNIDAWPIPKVNPKYIHAQQDESSKEKAVKESYEEESGFVTGFYLEAAGDTTPKPSSVTIDVDPKSEIKGGTVTLPDQEVAISYINNKKVLKITALGFGKLSKTHIKDNGEETVKGQEDEWYQSPKLALHLMTHDADRNKLTELVKLALKVMKERNADDIKAFNKKEKVHLLIKNMLAIESPVYEVPISQITAVQTWASQLLEDMEAFTSTDVDLAGLEPNTIRSLNNVVRVLMRIQISLNFISTAMNEDVLMLIDKKYYKSIKSLELLDEFVGKMIHVGIPPKYVAYNAWLIADECIRGTGEYKPCFGHARATLFPPNEKIVLKIGLSGLGTVSNETEVRFSKIFEDMDRVDLIAPVIKSFADNGIIAMERVKGNFDLSKSELAKYAENASEVLAEYQKKTGNRNVKLSKSSQHIGNVAFDERLKVYRSIDYGIHFREPKMKD